MRTKRITIVGYYGFRNAGDELMLKCLVDRIRTVCPDARITAFSNIPRETEAFHGVRGIAFHYNYPGGAAFFHTLQILRSDLLIFGGGSFLQDYGVNGWKGIAAYLKLVVTAKLLNKKVIILGAGAGPLASERGRTLSRRLVDLVDASVWRDPDSIGLLKSIGCCGDKLRLGMDLLFSSPMLRKSPAKSAGRNGKNVALSFFDFHDYVYGDREKSERYFEEVARLAERLTDEGHTLNLFCMQSDFAGKDNAFAAALKQRFSGVHIINFFDDADSFIHKLSEADFAIGMRYHFLLMCYLMRVPVVGISYNPKVRSLLRDLGLEKYAVELEDFTAETAWKLVDALTTTGTSLNFDEMMASRIDTNITTLNEYLT